MSVSFLKTLVSVNRVLTAVNGLIFGILVQFSPIHSRKGKALRISLPVNVALLVALIVLLVLVVRAYGPWESATVVPAFS